MEDCNGPGQPQRRLPFSFFPGKSKVMCVTLLNRGVRPRESQKDDIKQTVHADPQGVFVAFDAKPFKCRIKTLVAALITRFFTSFLAYKKCQVSSTDPEPLSTSSRCVCNQIVCHVVQWTP